MTPTQHERVRFGHDSAQHFTRRGRPAIVVNVEIRMGGCSPADCLGLARMKTYGPGSSFLPALRRVFDKNSAKGRTAASISGIRLPMLCAIP